MINTEQSQKHRLISAKRYENSDIFNRQPATPSHSFSSNNIGNFNSINNNNNNNGTNSNYNYNNNNFNSFKVSNSKQSNNSINRGVYEESRNEKKLIENPKTKRPDFIRNPFASQITIK